MSGQTIRRGGKGLRKTAAAQDKARQVRAARARTGSMLDSLLGWMPVTEQTLHRLFLTLILGGAAVLAGFVAVYAGVPALVRAQFAEAARGAGFQVRHVEVRGVRHLNQLQVYERALAQRDQAMPLVDTAGLRASLMQLAWVEDARVSRQLPDTLVLDIVERKPVAVLRKPDRLVLIDATGHELEPVSPARARGLLVVSGPGAGHEIEALGALLAAAPALKPQVTEAEWIGNRRWNLIFKTGQILALPEGETVSAAALMKFARLDGVNRLLGGKITAFDMRAPDRIYLRVPGRTDPVEQSGMAARPAASPSSSPSPDASTEDAASPAPAVKKADKAGKAVKTDKTGKPAKKQATRPRPEQG